MKNKRVRNSHLTFVQIYNYCSAKIKIQMLNRKINNSYNNNYNNNKINYNKIVRIII